MRIICGDCLEVMRTLSDSSIDAVIADPPYGTTQCKWDSIIPLPEMWEQLKRITKPNGAIVLSAQAPFDKVLGASNLQMIRYEWIWEKTAATGHLNAKVAPMKAHENILVFYSARPTYNPQMTRGHSPVHSFKSKADDVGGFYGKQAEREGGGSRERYPRSVLVFKSDKQRVSLHPTQKPVALMAYMVRTYTNPGETVLDFCMGSGTTGVAAIRAGRDFVGIERDARYFEIARNRIPGTQLTLL